MKKTVLMMTLCVGLSPCGNNNAKSEQQQANVPTALPVQGAAWVLAIGSYYCTTTLF